MDICFIRNSNVNFFKMYCSHRSHRLLSILLFRIPTAVPIDEGTERQLQLSIFYIPFYAGLQSMRSITSVTADIAVIK